MKNGTLYLLKEQSSLCMSFVLVSEDGCVMVIDGGETEDADYLRNFLGDAAVDTWLITHPHPDHIGAVNALLTDRSTPIKVKKFLFQHKPTSFWQTHEPLYAPYQETFLSLAEKAGIPVLPAEAGQTFHVGTCQVRIIMSASPAYNHPVMNNHSTVFRIDSPHRSAVFLGDLEPEGGDRLMQVTAGNRVILKADIVQVAHHGHMSVDKEIYACIRPKIGLWCAPQWLYEESGVLLKPRMYGTVKTREWFRELGIDENHVSYQGTIGIPF